MGSKVWRSSVGLLLGVCLMFLASPGRAEPSEQSRAAAEALFNDAGRLLREGKYEEACVKLASSQRLDPAVGTLLNLGRCYEKVGKTASAWLAFVDAASAAKAAGQGDREKTAREGAARLESAVPKLLIQVPSAVEVSGLEIKRDGEAFPRALWNIAAPTDPGDHAIEVVAPGKKPWSAKVHLKPAEEATVKVPVLTDDPNQKQVKPDTPGSTAEKSSGLGTQRTIAIVAGAVGVVGVGAGAVFGLGAKADADEADESCSGSTCSGQSGLDANESAQRKATLSTIFFGAGAALLAGGVVLWFTAPSAKPEQSARTAGAALAVSPVLDRDVGGVVLEGVW